MCRSIDIFLKKPLFVKKLTKINKIPLFSNLPYIYIYKVYMLKEWESEVPDVKQTTYASKKR